MIAEHFIYGLFKNYGIKLIKSPGLNNLLDGEIISYLCKLEQDKEYLWPNGTITITKVHPTNDEYGRNGVWNHTFAIKILDYLAFTQPVNLLKPHFIEQLEKPPETLEPLEVKKNE